MNTERLEEARLIAADNCFSKGPMAVISLSDGLVMRETPLYKFFFDPQVNNPNQTYCTDGLLILKLPKNMDGLGAIQLLAQCDKQVALRHVRMITSILWAFNALHSIDDLGQCAADLKHEVGCTRYAPTAIDFTDHMIFRAFECTDGRMSFSSIDIGPHFDTLLYSVSFSPIFPYVYQEGENYFLMGEYLSLFPQRPQDKSTSKSTGKSASKSAKKPSVFDALRNL